MIPFDLIPRIIAAQEWDELEKGLAQRVTALNRFIHDCYHDQEIFKAGLVPTDQLVGNAQFRPEMVDVIYRRVDDDFLDPDVFRPDSTLGCSGLMDVYRAGHVTI